LVSKIGPATGVSTAMLAHMRPIGFYDEFEDQFANPLLLSQLFCSRFYFVVSQLVFGYKYSLPIKTEIRSMTSTRRVTRLCDYHIIVGVVENERAREG